MKDRRRLAVAGLLTGAVALAVAAGAATQERDKRRPFVAYLTSRLAALVAFSPTNHDPRDGRDARVPSQESLAADVASLRPAFDGLILYGYQREVTPTVLAEMVRLKYRAVLLGVWDPKSREEGLAVARLADEYAGRLAVAICVGNEGLAFNRYRFDDVTRAAAIIAANLRHPQRVAFCTSEPYGEYGWAPLRGFGDFLAANIHPVFDRPELGPAEAVAWVRERAQSLAETARRPVLVKETGFPHGQRYTPELQAMFWSEYVKRRAVVRSAAGSEASVSFAAAFEAFDLPWKAKQSGIPIEDSWGLLNTVRVPYPAFAVWEARQRAAKE